MGGKLVVSLIGGVDGHEERLGIADVHHNWNAKRAELLKQGSKALVIDADQISARIPYHQPKIFPELESDDAVSHEPVNTFE